MVLHLQLVENNKLKYLYLKVLNQLKHHKEEPKMLFHYPLLLIIIIYIIMLLMQHLHFHLFILLLKVILMEINQSNLE